MRQSTLLVLSIIIIIIFTSTSFVNASGWFTSFNSNKHSSSSSDSPDVDESHTETTRNTRRGGGGGGGYFRRLHREEEDHHQHQEQQEDSSKIYFVDDNDANDFDDTKTDQQQHQIGIGSATGSVLGPHTPRDEASTQRNLKRQQSAPAKLLREWEVKGNHHPCWRTAVLRLRSLCEDVLTDKLKRTKLAMEFMACQLELDGKDSSAARCFDNNHDDVASSSSSGAAAEFSSCASKLPESLYPIKVQFDHHVDTLCFHLQEELLHDRTKQIVDRLGMASTQAARNLAELSMKSNQIDRSMQTMTVSQKQATASAETLAFALRQVNDLGLDIKKAFEDDKVGIDAVTEKVQTLLDTHELMKTSNEALANSLKILSEDHVRAVSALGTEVDSTRSKLLAGMEGLTSLQAKTSRFIGSLDAAIHYVFVFILIWIVTTSPRTQDSRFAALLAGPIASLIAERYLLRGFLKIFSLFGICTNPDLILDAHEYRFEQMRQQQEQQEQDQHQQQAGMNGYADMMNEGRAYQNDFSSSSSFNSNKANLLLDPTPLRNFFLIVAFLVIAVYAYFYKSPEERQRRILQIELQRALGRAVSGERSDEADNINNNNNKNSGRRIVPRLVSSMERENNNNENDDGNASTARKKRGSGKK